MLELSRDILGASLAVSGVVLLSVATLALWRIRDSAGRLHALTIADNLGLGLVAAGLGVLSGSWADAALLVLIWLVVLFAGTSAAQLLLSIGAGGTGNGR